MKIIDFKYAVALLIIAVNIVAEPKEIHCQREFDKEENDDYLKNNIPKNIEELKKSIAKDIAEWGKNNSLVKQQERRLKGYENALTLCPTADFYEKMVFIFDTDGLNNETMSNVEMYHYDYCGGETIARAAKVSSTPSLIYFSWKDRSDSLQEDWVISIDRKTFSASMNWYGMNSNRICTLKEVDTSNNIL